MLFLSVISIALVAVFLALVFYIGFDNQVKGELQNNAVLLEQVLNRIEDDADYLRLLSLSGGDIRITLIASDGSVTYDNMADSSGMENHAHRKEIVEALTDGTGESSRISSTFGEKAYYYSKKLSDGTVLRVSKTTSSIYGVFMRNLPICILIMLLILLLSHFIAKSLTKKITKPINDIDLNTAECVYDELSPLIRTITNQRQQIDSHISEIQQRNITTAAIVENMQEGILLLDKSGVILALNHSAMGLFGADEGAVGKNIIEITRNTEIIENSKAASEGVRSSFVVDISAKTYTAFFSPVSSGGAIVLFLDITDRANAEKMRREFSANVSHELKTPLTSISGYAEMIEGGMAEAEDVAAFAGKIKDEAARLLDLIEDIMKLSEMDEADRAKRFEEVDLAATAQEVAGSLRSKAAECGIAVKTDLQKTVVSANRQMMFELMYNLLDNAIKYSKPNGSVEIAVNSGDGAAKITVADNGIGISKAHIGRIFERFYRADKSHSKKTGGTGLGLSIVKHIAACHSGEVRVESEENVGTVVIVELPM